MKALFFSTLLFTLTLTALPVNTDAQIEETCPNLKPIRTSRSYPVEYSPTVREQLIKLCIKENKKEFEELVERTEEIEKLSTELKDSYDENTAFSDDDLKRLERLEILVKKVRSELRTSDEEEKDEQPDSVPVAVAELQIAAVDLAKEIKTTTRHSISLAAIRSSTTVMRIVKFLRAGN